MLGQVFRQGARGPRWQRESGARSQRQLRVFSHPTTQLRGRDGDLTLGQRETIAQLLDRSARREDLGLRSLAAAVQRLRSLNLQFGLGDLRLQQLAHRLLVRTFQPGHRRVPLQVRNGGLAGDLRQIDLALGAAHAGAALVRPGQLLHQPDRAHRHEVAGDAVAVGTVDRQVVETELEHRVGQLTGGRSRLAGSLGLRFGGTHEPRSRRGVCDGKL